MLDSISSCSDAGFFFQAWSGWPETAETTHTPPVRHHHYLSVVGSSRCVFLLSHYAEVGCNLSIDLAAPTIIPARPPRSEDEALATSSFRKALRGVLLALLGNGGSFRAAAMEIITCNIACGGVLCESVGYYGCGAGRFNHSRKTDSSL